MSELDKLLAERERLREKQMDAYHSGASRSKRTSYNFQINDINARIEIERKAANAVKP